jgi:hypothetical protein
MTSTAPKPREKKNEENLAKMPGPGDTISLRDATAIIQQRAPISAKGLDVSRLLKGLQDGRLSSGFFIGSDPILWVPIPSRFWIDVTTEAFKSVRANSHRQGGFFVAVKQFPAEYSAALTRSHKPAAGTYSADWFAAKLTEALRDSSKKRQVHLIADERWREYTWQLLDRALKDSSLASAKKGPGRREKGDWKIIYRVLAAHIIANHIDAISEQTRKEMAEEVLRQAYVLSEGKIDAPGTDAVEDEIRFLFKYLDEIKKN